MFFLCRRGVETIMVCSRLHNMRFFLDTIWVASYQERLYHDNNEYKAVGNRDFIAGTCWWSQTNSRAELRLGKEHMLNSEHFSFYRKICTVVSFSRFLNNCGGYSAFPPTVINSSFGFYVYDFFVKFINGLQLQGTSQIKFVALFTDRKQNSQTQKVNTNNYYKYKFTNCIS